MTTPNEILKEVKTRFTPLMHDEDDKLASLLKQALRMYQDRAGYLKRIEITSRDDATTRPDDMLALVGIVDRTDDLVYCADLGSKLSVHLTSCTPFPLVMTYLANLADLDPDSGTVPPEIIGIVANYLEALIAIPNTDRIRRVSIAGKLDVSNLADEQTLYQRKVDLEADMANRRAIIPAYTIYSAGGV